MEMSLVLSLDTMGQRYGMLPSKLIAQANTFDLVIMDMAMTYERHMNETSREGYIPDMSVDDLLKMKEGI